MGRLSRKNRGASHPRLDHGNWTVEQAASLPVNFFTAYFAYRKAGLVDKPPVPPFSLMPSPAEAAPPPC